LLQTNRFLESQKKDLSVLKRVFSSFFSAIQFPVPGALRAREQGGKQGGRIRMPPACRQPAIRFLEAAIQQNAPPAGEPAGFRGIPRSFSPRPG